MELKAFHLLDRITDRKKWKVDRITDRNQLNSLPSHPLLIFAYVQKRNRVPVVKMLMFQDPVVGQSRVAKAKLVFKQRKSKYSLLSM